jgi:hypothetical protein
MYYLFDLIFQLCVPLVQDQKNIFLIRSCKLEDSLAEEENLHTILMRCWFFWPCSDKYEIYPENDYDYPLNAQDTKYQE